MNCQYTLNSRDEIIDLDAGWQHSALLSRDERLLAEHVLNRRLWDFIADPTTEYLYRKAFEVVRSGTDLQFEIRCDAPDRIRLIEIAMKNREDGVILIENRLLKTELRDPQPILDAAAPRSDSVLIVCSWCNRVKVSDQDWQKIERAVITLGLFTIEKYPILSHGICQDCYVSNLQKIEK